MTEKQIMQWYKDNLLPFVNKAIEAKKITNPNLIYTPDWLIAIAYRETWTKTAKLLNEGRQLKEISRLMTGDYGQRPGEKEKIYHGYGFWQIDIGSFPDFIKSGQWADPYLCCMKAIDVLEGKRKYLFTGRFDQKKIGSDTAYKAITAAYNCGEGNVLKVLNAGQDVDSRTHNKDYSKMVWYYRTVYNSLK